MPDVVYKVKRKCDHLECVCTSFSSMFQCFTEEELGLKISVLYAGRQKNLKPFEVIETPKVYIEVLPLCKSRRLKGVEKIEMDELDDRVSEADLIEMLSVETQLMPEVEDRVYYIIDLIKKRTSHLNGKRDVVCGLELGGISFGSTSKYDEVFTLHDVERMRELGCYISRAGELCIRLTVD